MNKLLDKLVLCTLCMFSYMPFSQGLYLVVPVLCAVLISAVLSYFDKDAVRLAVFLVFCAISLAFESYLFFLPLICYDIFFLKWRFAFLAAVIPIAAAIMQYPAMTWVFMIFLLGLAYLFGRRTAELAHMKNEYTAIRDSTKEFSLRLESKNKELLEKQDYEVHLATLNERNRIAREIHDSIGHLLSSSILQTGALMATCKDDATAQRLGTLKSTLSEGMTSIRESIHGLYNESIDLYAGATELVKGFDFCDIALDYDVDSNPPKAVKFALLAVIKEALANIIRHSDATEVLVTLREHPGLYQLVIKDNGTKKEIGTDGIGLKNIEQRVEALGGNTHFHNDKGFTVFISLPKESAK